MRILAVKLRELGDIALWTPSLSALRQSYPNSEIHALVPRAAAPLLAHHPSVDRVHTVAYASSHALAWTLWKLRRERLDTLLGFHATTSLCRWAPLAGAKVRALHHHSLRKTPANSTVAIQNPGELQDAIERDFEVLRAIGVHPTNKRTSLFVSDAELEAVRTSVQKANPAGLPIVAFLPGARIETKRYPKDLWIQVLESVPRERMQPIIVVDPALSREWDLPSIAARLRTPIWDRLTLREMMAVLKLCDFAVGNDSGPTHIAAALGLKTLRFFGPACFADWHPYALEEHPALRVDIECRNLGPKDRPLFRYCTLDHCDHLSCLRKISPASATAKLQGLVDRVDADLKN